MNTVISTKVPDLNDRGEKKWNSMKVVLIVVSIMSFSMFVTGVMSLIYPDLGIPVWWIGFQIGPTPVPIPQ